MDALDKKKKKESLLISLLCVVVPLLGIGIWMMIDANKPEHLAVEKGSVYFVKEIWGFPAGLTIIVFGIVLLVLFLIQYRKTAKVKPNTLSYLIYSLAFPITLCCVVLYAIVILQNILVSFGAISSSFAYKDTSTINMGFITFIPDSALDY